MAYNDPNRTPRDIRVAAAHLSEVDAPVHLANGDEETPYLFSFTKGLPHEENGLLTDPASFESFRDGTLVHDPAPFAQTVPYRAMSNPFPGADLSRFPTDEPDRTRALYRRWESPTAGHAYVLQGPDPHAVTQPFAPKVGSAEFAAEMAEVYQMALSRDWTVAAFMSKDLVGELRTSDGGPLSAGCRNDIEKDNKRVAEAATRLSKMRWFEGTADDMLDPKLKPRRRHDVEQHPGNLFRGTGEDPWDTPFLSQFMVMGSGGPNRDDPAKLFEGRATGQIQYGAQRIPQMVRVAQSGKDYMTGWQDYLNVQNGLKARMTLPSEGAGAEFEDDAYRPMALMRDLATYVHDDQLYQAYLNAALIMLAENFPLDPGIPYHGTATRKFPFPGALHGDNNRSPFALFGPPHLLTLVTEVSSRALKAVRLQKFTVHRRLRPEAAGALFHTVYSGYEPHRDLPSSAPYGDTGDMDETRARAMLADTVAKYTFPQENGTVFGTEPVLEEILEDVKKHNDKQNNGALKPSWLLPMAFPEGSPMHPAYGAGHATVAGACVTLLKAFFAMHNNDGTPVYVVDRGERALVPDCGKNATKQQINLLSVPIENGLTLQSELNKLMWNISNGRNIAGVHYYTDYIESALLGEAITIGILREQMLTYHPDEHVEMTVPLLTKRTLPKALLTGQTALTPDQEVEVVKIKSNGTLEAV